MRDNKARGTSRFPQHTIDPKLKGRQWILDYIRAAWQDNAQATNIFYRRGYRYREIKDYALGNQPVNQYKRMLNISDDDNATWMNIDWRILPVITKFRRIALNKLKKLNYTVEATAVDSLAVEQKEQYIAEQKAKLAIKEELSKTNPDLAKKISNENDAEDYDDLKIKELYTYKHNATIELETGIDLILQQNKIQYSRSKIMEDLFDYGVAGYKDWIDSSGTVKFRRVNPESIVTNYCVENDFSDKQYAGEVIRMTIADLKQAAGNTFTDIEYKEIATLVKGRFGNPVTIPAPTIYSNGYDDFHIDVLDLEFYSVNELVYEKRKNRRGNVVFGRTSYKPKENTETKKYKRVAYKVVYEGSWIIGTNYIFNYGLATNMKRAKSNMTDTEMSYHIYAPEFFDMQAKGITEQLIPLANAIQIDWYKMQNAINQARPKGMTIDLDGLTDIPLGSGGKNLTPVEVLDLFNETGVYPFRRKDMAGDITNYRPIEELENGLGKDILVYYNLIQNNIQMIRDITGLNEFVDGSTPDPRALTTIANMAAEGANNALGDVVSGDQHLLKELATGLYKRLQDAVKFGNVTGYAKSLGSNSVKFIKVTSAISAHEFGIFTTLSLSDEEKNQFKAELKDMAAKNVIDPDTAIVIGNIRNKNQAEQVLAYMVKRKRDRDIAVAQEQQLVNGKIQQESAQVAEQAKQQTLTLENKGKIDVETIKGKNELDQINLKYQWEMKLAGVLNQGKIQNTAAQSIGRMAENEEAMVENAEKEATEK